MTPPLRFNINHYVQVRLTEYGKKAYSDYYRELLPNLRHPVLPPVDAEGWTTLQFWAVIQYFGSCFPFFTEDKRPFDMTIEIPVPLSEG